MGSRCVGNINIIPLYKANRDKHYEFRDVKTEYDRKIDEYCKKVLAYHKGKKKKVIKRSETDDESFQDSVNYPRNT